MDFELATQRVGTPLVFAAREGGSKILPVVPQLIIPIKKALASSEGAERRVAVASAVRLVFFFLSRASHVK